MNFKKIVSDKHPFIKWLLSILGIIILGAVGSGIWQIVGEPLINLVARITIEGISSIVGGYKDSIYIQASKGLHEESSKNLYVLFISAIPFVGVIFLLKEKIERNAKKVASLELVAMDNDEKK